MVSKAQTVENNFPDSARQDAAHGDLVARKIQDLQFWGMSARSPGTMGPS